MPVRRESHHLFYIGRQSTPALAPSLYFMMHGVPDGMRTGKKELSDSPNNDALFHIVKESACEFQAVVPDKMLICKYN